MNSKWFSPWVWRKEPAEEKSQRTAIYSLFPWGFTVLVRHRVIIVLPLSSGSVSRVNWDKKGSRNRLFNISLLDIFQILLNIWMTLKYKVLKPFVAMLFSQKKKEQVKVKNLKQFFLFVLFFLQFCVYRCWN